MARSKKAPWPPIQPREVAPLAERMAASMAEAQAQAAWETTVDEAALAQLLTGTEAVPLPKVEAALVGVIDVQEGRRQEWPCYQGKRISRATLAALRERLELIREALA